MGKFNNVYNLLQANDLPEIATILKKVYKKNPHSKGSSSKMWKEQCSVNLPILYLSSLYLNKYAKKKNYKHFLFAARDCCHWYKVYSKMYPTSKCTYFRCSRNMFKIASKYPRPYYRDYVEFCIKDNPVYIDIHGTGAHMIDYFTSTELPIPPCFFLSCGADSYTELPEKSYLQHQKKKLHSLVFNAHGSPIEMLNYDLCGTLNDFDSDGPIFDKMEYSPSLIKPYHDCVEVFVDMLDPNHLDKKFSPKNIRDIIQYCFKPISEIDQKPCISDYVDHLRKHPHSLLTEF